MCLDPISVTFIFLKWSHVSRPTAIFDFRASNIISCHVPNLGTFHIAEIREGSRILRPNSIPPGLPFPLSKTPLLFYLFIFIYLFILFFVLFCFVVLFITLPTRGSLGANRAKHGGRVVMIRCCSWLLFANFSRLGRGAMPLL